jgi:hypothetical protein
MLNHGNFAANIVKKGNYELLGSKDPSNLKSLASTNLQQSQIINRGWQT